MKKVILALAVFAFLSPGLATAQEKDSDDEYVLILEVSSGNRDGQAGGITSIDGLTRSGCHRASTNIKLTSKATNSTRNLIPYCLNKTTGEVFMIVGAGRY